MKVSIVTGSWNYEGGYVLGIFKDHKKAKELMEEINLQDNYEFVEVKEIELDKRLVGEQRINV